MDDYNKYEADCKKIRKANEKLLADFESWLRKSKLAKKTIRNHIENIDLYINEYLLYEEAAEAKLGVSRVSMFLGYWFIRKAMWASQAQIKSNAASLKKFYTFLFEKGMIEKDDLDYLKQEIKEEMPGWLATMSRYDDPSLTDMGTVWGM